MKKKLKCTQDRPLQNTWLFRKKILQTFKILTAFISLEILYVSNTIITVSNRSKAAEGGLGSGFIALKKCMYLAFSLLHLFSINTTRTKMLSQVSNANSEKKKEPLFLRFSKLQLELNTFFRASK